MAKVEIDTDELGMSVEQFGIAVSDIADGDVKLVVSAFDGKEELVEAASDGGQSLLMKTSGESSPGKNSLGESSTNTHESEYAPMPDYYPNEDSKRFEILLATSGKGFVDAATVAQRTNSTSKTVSTFTSQVTELFNKRTGSSTNGRRKVFKLTQKGENLARFIRDHGRGPANIDHGRALDVYKSLYNANKPLLSREVGVDMSSSDISSLLAHGERSGVVNREESSIASNIYVSELTELGEASLEIALSNM